MDTIIKNINDKYFMYYYEYFCIFCLKNKYEYNYKISDLFSNNYSIMFLFIFGLIIDYIYIYHGAKV